MLIRYGQAFQPHEAKYRALEQPSTHVKTLDLLPGLAGSPPKAAWFKPG